MNATTVSALAITGEHPIAVMNGNRRRFARAEVQAYAETRRAALR